METEIFSPTIRHFTLLELNLPSNEYSFYFNEYFRDDISPEFIYELNSYYYDPSTIYYDMKFSNKFSLKHFKYYCSQKPVRDEIAYNISDFWDFDSDFDHNLTVLKTIYGHCSSGLITISENDAFENWTNSERAIFLIEKTGNINYARCVLSHFIKRELAESIANLVDAFPEIYTSKYVFDVIHDSVPNGKSIMTAIKHGIKNDSHTQNQNGV